MRIHRRITGTIVATLVAAAGISGLTTTTADATTSRTSSARAAMTASEYRAARVTRLHRAGARPASVTARAVTRAVRASEFTEGIPASAYSVGRVRTAGSWARATLTPKPTADLDTATVVLHRTARGWTVVDLGSYEVGCEVAPSSALRALSLTCGGPEA